MNCDGCAWPPRSVQSAVCPTTLPSVSADIKDTERQDLKQTATFSGTTNRPFGDQPVENRTLQVSVSTKGSSLSAAEMGQTHC